MHAFAFIRASICILINASLYTLACTYTRVQTHALKDTHARYFYIQDDWDLTSFIKEKFICHCMLISKCSNYNPKQRTLTHVGLKFGGSKRSIIVNK